MPLRRDDQSFDEPTPVNEPPLEEIKRRLRVTSGKLDTLSSTVTEFVERDQREHAELREDMREAAKNQTDLAKQVVELRERTANMDGKLDILVAEHHSKLKREEIREETTAKVTLLDREDQVDARKTKRQIGLKLWGLILTLGGAIATAIAAAVS